MIWQGLRKKYDKFVILEDSVVNDILSVMEISSLIDNVNWVLNWA